MMGDYNERKLPDPCMRIDFGGNESASIEAGDGTGFVQIKYLEEQRCRAEMLAGLLKETIQIATDVFRSVPPKHLPVSFAAQMNAVIRRAEAEGIEV